jgi:hypothetical protein
LMFGMEFILWEFMNSSFSSVIWRSTTA